MIIDSNARYPPGAVSRGRLPSDGFRLIRFIRRRRSEWLRQPSPVIRQAVARMSATYKSEHSTVGGHDPVPSDWCGEGRQDRGDPELPAQIASGPSESGHSVGWCGDCGPSEQVWGDRYSRMEVIRIYIAWLLTFVWYCEGRCLRLAASQPPKIDTWGQTTVVHGCNRSLVHPLRSGQILDDLDLRSHQDLSLGRPRRTGSVGAHPANLL